MMCMTASQCYLCTHNAEKERYFLLFDFSRILLYNITEYDEINYK